MQNTTNASPLEATVVHTMDCDRVSYGDDCIGTCPVVYI